MNKIFLFILTVVCIFGSISCTSMFFVEPIKQDSMYNPEKTYIAGRIELVGEDGTAEASGEPIIVYLLEDEMKEDKGEFIWAKTGEYFVLPIEPKDYFLIAFLMPSMGFNVGNTRYAGNQFRFSIWPKVATKQEKSIFYIGDIYIKVVENSLGIMEPRMFIEDEIESARIELNSQLMDSSGSYLKIEEHILTPDSIPCQILTVTETRM